MKERNPHGIYPEGPEELALTEDLVDEIPTQEPRPYIFNGTMF